MKQRETELILQAARLYYEDELSQDQVAAKLNISNLLFLSSHISNHTNLAHPTTLRMTFSTS